MNISRFRQSVWSRLLACLLVSLGLGALLAGVGGQGVFIVGWLGSSAVLLFSLVLMLLAWRWAGGGKMLAWMVVLAFILRLGTGLALEWALPRFAHNSPVEQAGYVFADAYARDTQAWKLAASNVPIGTAFGQEFISDQYGGLLALSAGVYRIFSPDIHRPYLIIILAAAAAALGLPFLWVSFKRKWGEPIARLAGWILVLFPESILLGSAQMREPFLISMSAVAFWAVLSWHSGGRKAALAAAFAGSAAGLLLFSSRMALPVLAVCAGWFLLEDADRSSAAWQRWLKWLGLALIGVVLVVFSWGWLRSTAQWDAKVAIMNSGILQYLTTGMPSFLKIPFLVSYGMAQPVLPAALIDPAPLVWRIVGILRAVGWYMLAPLLVYAVFTVWKIKPLKDRREMIYLLVVCWGWILLSSARAGGDQWDNPRYRMVFLVWLATLTAWAWNWARSHKDAWLWRLAAVEVIFLGFFTTWYISRYLKWIRNFSFWIMVGLIIVLSLVVLLGGWIWDQIRAKQSQPK